MKYLAAYALVALSGKKDINAADIKKVLGDAQIAADDSDITRLLDSVKGKQIHQLIADGTKQIGGSGPAPVAAGGKSEAKPAVAKEEPKKDDKKDDKKKNVPPPPPPPPADDDDFFGGGGLFD